MNILNAKVSDSYDSNGQPTGVKQSPLYLDMLIASTPSDNLAPGGNVTSYYTTSWKAGAGNFNESSGEGASLSNFSYGDATSPGPSGFNFVITPDQGYSVAAEAYKWNVDNPEAVASDGKLSKDIIEDVLFFDSTEPWAEDNIVKVVVVWKDDFVYPAPSIDNPNGYPVYKVMIDIMDDPGAQLFGVRFVNLCIVNDFADAVWCDRSGNPSISHIDDMAENYLHQQGWDKVFQEKRPLKYRGVVQSAVHPFTVDIEGVKFEPAVDPTGQTAHYYDTRDLHLSGLSQGENIPSEDAYGVSDSSLSGAEGFQNLSRKDVIYVGMHVKNGEATKIGRITLKLNQDLYVPYDKEGDPYFSPIGSQQFQNGYIANLGRVNGWAGKWHWLQTDPANMMTWEGSSYGNSMISGNKVNAPHGNVAISRVDPSGTNVNDADDFLYSAGENEVTGGPVYYETDQAHRPIMPDNPIATGNAMKLFMTQSDEIRPNLYDGSYDTFGSAPGSFQGDLLSHNYLISQGFYDSGTPFYIGQDVNQYIIDVNDFGATGLTDKLTEAYKSIAFWSDALYSRLDLNPWAFFPTFGVGGDACYSTDSNPVTGQECINKISAQTGKFSGHEKFILNNFELKAWADGMDWVYSSIANDPNNQLSHFVHFGNGSLDQPYAPVTLQNEITDY